MPATAHSAPLKRIRDLLALARSPEPHEAALAQKRADELLRVHNLTEADLVEEATEVTKLPVALDGSQREELARIVAYSRGASAKTNGHEIAFRGYPEAAKDARELFTRLTHIVESECDCTGPEAARLLWRTCYWLGYTNAIQRQLDPEHASLPKEALPLLLKNARIPPFVARAAQSFELLRSQFNDAGAERFKQMAYDAGLNRGAHILVPPYKGKR